MTSDCQKESDDAIDDGQEFVVLRDILQNIQGKGIATAIGNVKGREVVIKVQSAAAAHKENMVGEKLKASQWSHGFASFACMFVCNSKATNVTRFGVPQSTNPSAKVCIDKGSTTGIIVMPYFEGGSFEDFLRKNASDVSTVKATMAKVLEVVFGAYSDEGFTHGDLFTKNVMFDGIAGKGDVKIIDFEMSRFDDDRKLDAFWRDIDDFLGDVARYALRDKIYDAIHGHVTMARAYRTFPNDKIRKAIIDVL